MSDLLEELDALWDDTAPAEKTAGSGDKLPEGDYTVDVTEARLTTTKTTGKPMLAWTFCVVSSPGKGRYIWKNDVLDPARLPYVKADLDLCGVHLKKFSELEQRSRDLEGLRLKVAVKHKGDYTNVYINELLPTPSSMPAQEPAEEDIPF